MSAVCFHPELPVILTGSEDGSVKIWHSTTYRLENPLNYGLERLWALGACKGSNLCAPRCSAPQHTCVPIWGLTPSGVCMHTSGLCGLRLASHLPSCSASSAGAGPSCMQQRLVHEQALQRMRKWHPNRGVRARTCRTRSGPLVRLCAG